VTKTIFFGDSDFTIGSISKPGVNRDVEDPEEVDEEEVGGAGVLFSVAVDDDEEEAAAAAAASFAAFSTVYSESPPTYTSGNSPANAGSTFPPFSLVVVLLSFSVAAVALLFPLLPPLVLFVVVVFALFVFFTVETLACKSRFKASFSALMAAICAKISASDEDNSSESVAIDFIARLLLFFFGGKAFPHLLLLSVIIVRRRCWNDDDDGTLLVFVFEDERTQHKDDDDDDAIIPYALLFLFLSFSLFLFLNERFVCVYNVSSYSTNLSLEYLFFRLSFWANLEQN
jgi:hypothetical protein